MPDFNNIVGTHTGELSVDLSAWTPPINTQCCVILVLIRKPACERGLLYSERDPTHKIHIIHKVLQLEWLGCSLCNTCHSILLDVSFCVLLDGIFEALCYPCSLHVVGFWMFVVLQLLFVQMYFHLTQNILHILFRCRICLMC